MAGQFRALALAGVASLSISASAHAGAFGLREQSAQGQGLGFAGAAAGSAGVSSIFWNPATVTMRPGWVVEGSLTYLGLTGDITPTVGTDPRFLPLGPSGEIGQGAVAPSFASSYQLNDRLWIGIQSGAPFGLVTNPNRVWAGQELARSSRVFSLAFNPVIGYRVTDWLSVAAGPIFEYFKITLRQAQAVPGVPPAFYPSGFLKGDSWGYGFTAGATITPLPGTVLGVGYRSSIDHDIEGSAFFVGRVRANLNTPDKVSFGLTQAISPVARFNFGFEWDNWSRVGTIPVISQTFGVAVATLPLNLKDGFYYAVGGEYDWSPAFTVRAGVSYEQAPIDFSNRGPRLPDNDRIGLSVGGSYRWSDQIALHVGYTHLFVDRSRILAGPGLNYDTIAFAGIADVSADIVSVGFRYVFGGPVVPLPAPIVRKY